MPELKPVEADLYSPRKKDVQVGSLKQELHALKKEVESPRKLVVGGCHNKLTDMEHWMRAPHFGYEGLVLANETRREMQLA